MKKDNYLIILVPGLIPRQKRIFQADTSAAEVDVYVAGCEKNMAKYRENVRTRNVI